MKEFFISLKALAVFLGTVIGVGIFALPFVASRAGFLVTLIYLIAVTFFVIVIQSLYAEVILGTKKVHRLPGYVSQYLNPIWGKVIFLIIFLGAGGSLVAYLIIGGQFLFSLLFPVFGGNPLIYSLLFFLPAAILVFKGIKSIAGVELFLSVIFIAILILIFTESLPSINLENLQTFNANYLALPYGVILYAFWGSSIIPEVKEFLGSSSKKDLKRKLKKILFWGIIFCFFVYLLFIFSVVGVSGSFTSEDAISGLENKLGGKVLALGFVFGLMACFTSFLSSALTLKKVFWYDLGVKKNLSWALTCFVPLIFFLLGVRRFIDVIGFTGAIALGLEGIVVILLYREYLKDNFSKKMNLMYYLLGLVFLLGIIFEIAYFFMV